MHPYHSAECERTESCVECGKQIAPEKCACGYWMNHCTECEHKRIASDRAKWVENKLKEMRADFNKRMDEKYGTGTG